ncbi:MAG: DUF805 domain-containing protein [Epsilonproteobacteria bacterium]|nr:DUF805 domain-containing protein [Campylobacterota bacterium]
MNYFNRYFVDVVKNKYFQFSGRASRSEFWYFVLFSIIVAIVVAIVGTALGIQYMMPMDTVSVSPTGELINVTQEMPVNILQIIVSLALFFPSLAIAIRRLHDIGRTGWWYLVGLIPLVGALVLIAFFVMPSQKEDNQYGAFSIE